MSKLWQHIETEAELNTLLSPGNLASGDCYAILKHSPRCAMSAVAKTRLDRKMDSRINYFIIDVVGNRDVSQALASQTGVHHESPQLFLFHSGVLIDVKSHMAISASELSRRLNAIIQIET